jgi:hypothetical protein
MKSFAHFASMSVAFTGLCGCRVSLLQGDEFCFQTFGSSSCMRTRPFARPLPTQDNTGTKETHTYIHMLSVLGALGPSFRAVEEYSWLRPRSHGDRSRNLYSWRIKVLLLG